MSDARPVVQPDPSAGLLILDERDVVAVATRDLAVGERFSDRGREIEVREPIPFGHKIALEAIAAGSPVRKYGEVIGTATSAILPGTHVHVHNLVSARLPGPTS